MNKNFYSIGLMSGTSMDGIDASIIKSDGEKTLKIIDDMYLKYDKKLKSDLNTIIDSCFSRKDFKKLHKNIKKIEEKITLKHAEICHLIKNKNKNIKIDIIGFHGQTILHKPNKGYSIQIGDAKLLSKITKLAVVSNFRKNDIFNGGQGAPLTPIYHKLILEKTKLNLPSVVINIGGISNITYVKNKNKIISFDTGPGNYLINKWVQNKSSREFDNKGNLARSGKVNKLVLEKFLKNYYTKKKLAQSLDVKDFKLKEINDLSLEDGCATLSMITAKSICKAIKSFKKFPSNILFSGGGRKNDYVIDNISKILNKKTYLIDKFNFNGDFIESQAFAYLAIRSYLHKFITFPSTTGVKKNCIGGIFFKF